MGVAWAMGGCTSVGTPRVQPVPKPSDPFCGGCMATWDAKCLWREKHYCKPDPVRIWQQDQRVPEGGPSHV